MWFRKFSFTSGMYGTPVPGVVQPVDLDVKVARHADREEVDRRAADDLVGCMWIEKTRGRGRATHRNRRGEQAQLPGVELVGAEDPEEAAGQHHPLEADVHPAPLGEHAADRRNASGVAR
jgi:hypothetical protein